VQRRDETKRDETRRCVTEQAVNRGIYSLKRNQTSSLFKRTSYNRDDEAITDIYIYIGSG